MRHHLDREIATELSYRTFQLRRERGELGSGLSDRNHQLVNIPSMIANRHRFIADGNQFAGDSAQPNPPSRAVGERER